MPMLFGEFNVGDEFFDGDINVIVIDTTDISVEYFDGEGSQHWISREEFSEWMFEAQAKIVTGDAPLIDRLKVWCEQHPDFPVEKVMPSGD